MTDPKKTNRDAGALAFAGAIMLVLAVVGWVIVTMPEPEPPPPSTVPIATAPMFGLCVDYASGEIHSVDCVSVPTIEDWAAVLDAIRAQPQVLQALKARPQKEIGPQPKEQP